MRATRAASLGLRCGTQKFVGVILSRTEHQALQQGRKTYDFGNMRIEIKNALKETAHSRSAHQPKCLLQYSTP